MAEADELVKQAMVALKAGRKAEARTLLEQAVDQDQRHENAWFYLSAAVDSLEEQEICLENVLALNPNHAKAKQGLESVRQKMGKSPSSAAPGTSPAPSAGTQPFGSPASPPGGAGFETTSGGSPFGGASDAPPANDEGFDWFSGSSGTPPAETTDADSFASPTSVDWGRDDKPATYGSGQDVEMPSAQEWESWVQGLNIAKETPPAAPEPPSDPFGSSSSPFVMDEDAPFGETAYMVDDDDSSFMDQFQPDDVKEQQPDDTSAPFGGSSPWTSPFGDETAAAEEEDTFSAFGEQEAAPSPFGATPFDSEDLYTDEAAPASPGFAFDAVEIGEEDLVFDFDEGEGDEPAAPTSKASAQTVKPSAKAAPRPGAEYFRLIPGEIEAKAGGIDQRQLMMLGGIVILLVLNAVSFAMLL